MNRQPASVFPQLFNINGTLAAILDKAYEAHVQDALLDANGGQEILDFNMPWGDPKIPLIKNEMTIKFNGVIFRVRTPTSGYDTQGALSFQVHCEALWYDLQASDPRPAISTTTAISSLNAAVSGTGWTVGTVNPAQSATFSAEKGQSALAVIRAVPSVFGGELEFDTVNKIVHLRTTRGTTTGALYARGKNATQDIITVDTTNMYTRVYPTGANGIDISTVNAGSKYLEDYSYYDGLGAPHIVRATSIQNTALTTPAQVLAWGQGQINIMRNPAITYAFSVASLRSDSIPSLGDIVRVWDKVLGYQTNARVIARNLYPLDPSKNVLTINTAAANLTTDLATGTPASQVTTTTDTLAPATPTNVQLTANYSFTGQGMRQITVSVSWTAVTTNSDASPITDLDHYEVQYQVDSSGVWIPMGNTTDTAIMSPLLSVQTSVIARVAAVDHSGNRSPWAQTSGSITADTAAPATPTALTLATGTFPLTIEATWDGNTVNNHPMIVDSPDFAFLEVHMSTVSGFTPTTATLIDTIVGSVGGTAVAPGLTPGVTYYFTSVAVDRAGNRSAKSTQVSGTTGALPANYIGSVSISSLTAGSAALGTLHADISVAARIKTADVGARVEMNAAGIFAYDAGNINTVAIRNDGSASFTGTITASTITGSTITTDTSQLNYVVLNASGLQVTHEGTTNVIMNPSMITAYTNGPSFGGAFLTTDPSYTTAGFPGAGSLTADPFARLVPNTLGGSNGTLGPNKLNAYMAGSLGSLGLIGSTSICVVMTTTVVQTTQQALGLATQALVPGQPYTYSVFVFTASSGMYIDPTKFGLQESAGPGRFLTGASVGLVALTPSQWTRVVGAVTLPGDWNTSAPTMLIVDWMRTSSGGYQPQSTSFFPKMYVDGSQVEQKTHVTDLITGALPNGSWQGAANGSPSVRAATVVTDAATNSATGQWPTWLGEFTTAPALAGTARLVLGPQDPIGVQPQASLIVDGGDSAGTVAGIVGSLDGSNNGILTIFGSVIRGQGTALLVQDLFGGNGPFMQFSGTAINVGGAPLQLSGDMSTSDYVFGVTSGLLGAYRWGLWADNTGASGLVGASRLWWDGPDGSDYVIGPRGGGATFYQIRLRADNYQLDALGTGAGTTVVYTSGSKLVKSSSSMRYKEDVRPYTGDLSRLLDIELYEWRDKHAIAHGEPTAERYWLGTTAEHIDELGLEDLLIRDADNRPDAVMYERIGIGLIPTVREQGVAIREQNAVTAELSDEVRSLRNRIAALEKASKT